MGIWFVSRLSIGLGFALLLLAAGDVPVAAQVALAPESARVCEPPISTCVPGPIRLEGRQPDLGPSILPDDCPAGYACECVPSCPVCRDCATYVCVRDARSECKTACDCRPGFGCFEGQCLAGFAPVFCCERDACEAPYQCQHRDGTLDRCPVPDPPDASCRERVRKVTHEIDRLVKGGAWCRQASDCVQIDTSTECIGTCGAFVNRDRARRIASAIDDLDRRICDGFQEDGCPFAIPACQALVPACIRNRCTGVPYLPGPPRPRPIQDVLPLGPGGLRQVDRRR